MTQLDDEKFIRMAIRLAEQAVQHGNQPFGALVVDQDGEIVVQAESTKITAGDCTRHAELTVAAQASMVLDRESLALCTLYTSTEPCAMCTGAIYWSGIGRVVFGCSNDSLGALSGDNLRINCADILKRGTRKIEVVGPVLEAEAVIGHKNYWKSPRTWWREPDSSTG